MGGEHQQVRLQSEPNAAVLLVRQDGRPLERLTERLPIRLHPLGGVGRNDPSVLRETTIDQLRSEANVADLSANVICSDPELEASLRTQNSLQLKYTLARHDHLLTRLALAFGLHLAQRQTVAVRG